MRRRAVAAAVCVVAMAAASAAAAPPRGAVATVGGERVTADEVRAELKQTDLKHETMGMAGKDAAATALERIVRRKLVELDVKKRNLLDGPLGDRYQAVLIPGNARIYRRVRLPEIVVPDAAVDEALSAIAKERRRVSYIVTTNPDAMREVRRRLAAGEGFSDLAKALSEGPAAERGGDLGWLEKGEKDYFVDEQWAEIFKLPTGGTTGVYPSALFDGAVTLARVEGIEALAPDVLESRRTSIRDAARDRRFDEEVARLVREAKLVIRAGALGKIATSDRRDVLASFSGGSVTAGMFRAYCDSVQIDYRTAAASDLEGHLKFFAEQAVLAAKKKDSLLARAGLGKAIRLGTSGALLKAYFEELTGRLTVTDADLTRYYREHPAENRREEQVDLWEIRCATRKEAEEAAARLKKGEEFETVAMLFAQTEDIRRQAGRGGMLVRGSVFPPQIDDVIFSLPLMQPSPPVETRFGWHIFMVGRKVPAKVLTFEEKRGSIRQEVLVEKQTRLYIETFNRLREQFPIVIDRAALEKL